MNAHLIRFLKALLKTGLVLMMLVVLAGPQGRVTGLEGPPKDALTLNPGPTGQGGDTWRAFGPAMSKGQTADLATRLEVSHAYGQLPLRFEPNRGQADPRVQFLSRGRGYTLFLAPGEAVLSLRKPREGVAEEEEPGYSSSDPARSASSVVRMELRGASRAARVSGIDELPGRTNYFIGRDPERWQTNIPSYARVRYEGVYPGVDLVFYGTHQRQLEYDFVVAPGADPRPIRLGFQGMDGLRHDEAGNLILQTGEGELILQAPTLYQEISGVRQKVSGRYIVQGQDQVAFEIAPYDVTRSLVIDPVLSYSTYLGGGGSEEATAIALDSSGNAYVTGSTNSSNFPRAGTPFQSSFGGSGDAFISKLNAAGSALVYSTYLGGSSTDHARGIALDSSGNAYVTGFTESSNFPTAGTPFQSFFGGVGDAFVSKLNAAGSSLVYSTYLGGGGSDQALAIALDSSGNAYVTGFTLSSNFPRAGTPFQSSHGGGHEDAFISKLNAAGSSLVYSTYLGGSDHDLATGIALDSSGNAYLTGFTVSSNFPTAGTPFQSSLGGTFDAFVSKLNAAGSSLVYSTYLGGSDGDFARAIALDSSGNAYVAGETGSSNFPTAGTPFQSSHGGGFDDAFVSKLNAAGSALVYSTYLGGNGGDVALAMALDSSGNAYLTGYTNSSNFPTAGTPPFQPSFGGSFDAFVSKLNAAGSLVYSTHLGGNDDDGAEAIALDSSGNAYVTGSTISSNFPTAGTPFQSSFGGSSDAFVAKVTGFVPISPMPSVTAVAPDIVSAGGESFTLTVEGTNFVADSVVRWNGSDRLTTFVSSTRLTATILASDVATPDTTANVTVATPGGGESNAKTVSIKGLLYFPIVDRTSALFTGFALANTSAASIGATLEAFKNDGSAIGSSSSFLTVGSNQQVAKLTEELFTALGPSESGWFRVTHATSSVVLKGFFLHGKLDLSTIDGVDVNDRLSTDLVFPIVSETASGKSQIVLVNPNPLDAKLTIELFSTLGSNEPASTKRLKKENLTLVQKGRLEQTVSQLFDGTDILSLFPTESPLGQLYVRVKSDLGLFGFQTLPERTSSADFVALRGQDVATESGNELHFAHLAEGLGYETLLSLISLKTPKASASVDIKIVLDNGVTQTVNKIIPPDGVLRMKLRDLFSVLASDRVNVGYLKATSKNDTVDGTSISAGPMMGSITFKHSANGATAALPGQKSPSAKLTFSHVAVQDVQVTSDAWLTGIAFLNSTNDDATLKITVFKPDGTVAGVRENYSLKAGQRLSRLLVELVREVKNQAGGYVVVESKKASNPAQDLPIYGFELFGDWTLKKLAAVPAQ